jgi:hypothetical protein
LPDDLVAFLQEKGFVSSTLIESALDDSSRDAAYDLLAALEAPLIKSRLWSKALVDWLASGGEAAAKRQRTLGVIAPLDVKAEVVASALSSAKSTVTAVINAVLDDCVKVAVWKNATAEGNGLGFRPARKSRYRAEGA